MLSSGCHFEEWGIQLYWSLEVAEITSENEESSNEMETEFHDRPRPRWLEATSVFLKSSPSGPEFPIVCSGKRTDSKGWWSATNATKKWLEETRWVWNLETSHTDRQNMFICLFVCFCWIECQFRLNEESIQTQHYSSYFTWIDKFVFI